MGKRPTLNSLGFEDTCAVHSIDAMHLRQLLSEADQQGVTQYTPEIIQTNRLHGAKPALITMAKHMRPKPTHIRLHGAHA